MIKLGGMMPTCQRQPLPINAFNRLFNISYDEVAGLNGQDEVFLWFTEQFRKFDWTTAREWIP
jgi:hypothetical protein